MIHNTVREKFFAFNVPFEGAISHLYADVRNLVTIGVGCLVDPLPMALALPMRRADGTLATAQEIAADWNAVKGDPLCTTRGHAYAAKLTRLHLEPADIEALVLRRLDDFAAHLAKRFPAFDSWPWQVQLAVLSIAWACGPGFRFPRMEQALRDGDFLWAAAECEIDASGNAGVIGRNKANEALLMRAYCLAPCVSPSRPASVRVLALERAYAEAHDPEMTDLERANAIAGLATGLALGVERAIDMGREERDADA
jgi:GH24 family phage-related lysozyme (muramidase)